MAIMGTDWENYYPTNEPSTNPIGYAQPRPKKFPWEGFKLYGPTTNNQGGQEYGGGYFTIHTTLPPIPKVEPWNPSYDQNFLDFLSYLGQKTREIMERPKGLTPREEALLRARMAEASKGALSSAQQSAVQSLYNMGLYGSPAAAKVQSEIASKYIAQELNRLRDLQIQEQQEAWNRTLQAHQLGQAYANLMENWENIKNRYGLAAAQLLRQDLYRRWQMAAQAAAAKRADIMAQEQINMARRNEMLKWLLALKGLYGTDYGRAMQGWGQQWSNYWGGQQMANQNSANWSSGLGMLGAMLMDSLGGGVGGSASAGIGEALGSASAAL